MAAEAPEFALLSPASKALVRRLGCIENQEIAAETGAPGKGWCTLEDEGWVRIRRRFFGGYVVHFTLSGWEFWCRQCDAEEGRPLQEIMFA